MRNPAAWCALALSLVPLAATAEDATEYPGDYLNLSFAGDGTTPTAMSLFENQERQLAAPRFDATVSDKGDAGHAIRIPLPPARLAPSISLSYSSAGGSHSHVGRGWTLDAGMQISRVTGQVASQAYADLPGTHRISGGGLDGLLFESDGDWVYASTGTVAVEATYEAFGWVVRSGGVTTWLEPHGTLYDDDDYSFDWSDERSPMVWHVTRTRDVKGNTVEYAWSGNRLDSILYGGATDEDGGERGGEEHLVEVQFDYETREFPSYQAQGSQTRGPDASVLGAGVDVIEDRLVRVVVKTAFATLAIEDQLAIELSYDEIDGDRLLTGVVQRDLVRGTALTIAELDYARLPDPSDYDWSAETTPHIAWSNSVSKVDGQPSWNHTLATLLDVTGDGLADVLEASGLDELVARWQLWGSTTGESTWEADSRDLGSVSEVPAVDRTVTVPCSKDWSKSVSVQRLVDIDGDGLQDIVYSHAPVATETYDSARDYTPPGLEDFCGEADAELLAVNQSGGLVAWTIRFGTPGGFAAEAVPIDSPADFPRISRLEVTAIYNRDAFPEWIDVADTHVDLMDLDGDGWQDIVTAIEGDGGGQQLWVFYHEGWREGGWSLDPVRLTVADDPLEGALFGLSSSRQHLLGLEYLPYQAEWSQFTLQVTETWSLRGFRDVNGDGILDYVDANPWTAETWEYWDVHLGTGRRGEGTFHSPPLAWPAPVGYLGRTNEGVPQVLTCSLSEDQGLPDGEGAWIGNFPMAIDAGIDGGEIVADVGGLPAPCAFATPPSELDLDVDVDPVTPVAPQRQTVDLLDMDGDGRLDLVDADADCPTCEGYRTLWWRNTGAGFTPSATEGPDWFGGALDAAILRTVVFLRPDALTSPGGSMTTTDTRRVALWSVVDVNRDGVPDRVRIDDPDTYTTNEGRTWYGMRPDAGTTWSEGTARPGLLTSIRTTFGAATTLAYVSSATLWPVGTADFTHEMANHRDVVSRVEVVDPVTGNAAVREHDYGRGICEGGLCLGFEQGSRTDLIYDAQVHGLHGGDRQLMSSTFTDYLLDRDHAVPERVVVQVNAADPAITGSPVEDPDLRKEIEYRYAYDDVVLGSRTGATVTMRWLQKRTITEFPEDSADDSREWFVEIERNDHGFPTQVAHLIHECARVPSKWGFDLDKKKSGGPRCLMRHADDVKLVVAYTNDAGETHFVPSSMSTYQRDPDSLAWELVERGELAYDDGGVGDPVTAGLLTAQHVSSGVGGALRSETLDWTFTRNARGAITRTDAPGGRVHIVVPVLGDALPGSEENGVGHVVLHEYDALGREIVTVDPNGMQSRTDRDGFGRPISEHLSPSGGAEYATALYEYVDTPGAAYVEVTRYHHDAPGLRAKARTEYQVLDGFGDVVQSWRPAESLGEWIVQDTHKDIAGNDLRTSYPERRFAFEVDVQQSRAVELFTSWRELDAFGRPRQTYEDYYHGLGAVTYDYARPGWVKSLDSDGTVKLQHFDTHRRMVNVYEGAGRLRQTATWKYDGRHRVVGFTDGNDNRYDYVFDGAGRLREVSREASDASWLTPCLESKKGVRPKVCDSGSPSRVWVTYVYDGPDPIEMWEGRDVSGTLVAEWDYDAIGRPERKGVLDRDTGAPSEFTWGWDAQWKGARDYVTDPSGRTDYTYARDVFGKFGRVSSVARTWSDGRDATFDYEYAFDGQPTLTTWPTGAQVAATYTSTRWLKGHDLEWTTGSAGSASVTYDYDEWGLPAGWSGGEPDDEFVAFVQRDTPTRITLLGWTMPDGEVAGLGYDWRPSGLLDRKVVNRSRSFAAFRYDYDAWQRVTSMEHTGLGTLESYTYDTIGNLVEMSRSGEGAWAYEPGPFSEIPGRTNATTGVTESHVYDGFGRMATWDTVGASSGDVLRDYTYDGAGRLTRVTQASSSLLSAETRYGYDVDDQLVLETHESTFSIVDKQIYRFQGHRHATGAKGRTIEKLLPMVALADGELRWTLTELDGHALATYASTGAEESFEVLGVYGVELGGYSFGGGWPVDAFHGSDPDKASSVVHFGARHMLLRDGMWMQPEPLLYLGPTSGDLGRPSAYTGVYASGDPVNMRDYTGRYAEPAVAVVLKVASGVTVGGALGAGAVGGGVGVVGCAAIGGNCAVGLTAAVTWVVTLGDWDAAVEAGERVVTEQRSEQDSSTLGPSGDEGGPEDDDHGAQPGPNREVPPDQEQGPKGPEWDRKPNQPRPEPRPDKPILPTQDPTPGRPPGGPNVPPEPAPVPDQEPKPHTNE